MSAARTPMRSSPEVPVSAIEQTLGHSVEDARVRYARLTPREVETALLMAQGKPNRWIAEQLGISVKTLDIHRANVKHKLGARTTAGVANLVNLVRLAESPKAAAGKPPSP